MAKKANYPGCLSDLATWLCHPSSRIPADIVASDGLIHHSFHQVKAKLTHCEFQLSCFIPIIKVLFNISKLILNLSLRRRTSMFYLD